MLNKFSKLRSKASSHQRDKSNTYTGTGAPTVSIDTFGSRASIDGSAYSQNSGVHSPWLEDSDWDTGSASSLAESIFPVETSNGHLVGKSYAGSIVSEGNQSSKPSWASSSLPEEDINIGPSALPSYEDAYEEFLENQEDYFEHLHVDNIRKEQYPSLDLQRITYLDYANIALFSRIQVEEHMRVLLEEGPCHGRASLSKASVSHLVEYAHNTQERLLQILSTSRSEYTVVITTGLGAGFRFLGDMYAFQKGSLLLVCQDNHEAVKHVITAAKEAGGKSILAPVDESNLSMQGNQVKRILTKQGWRSGGSGLFIYPAQSCLSGIKHSLDWIPEAQQNGWGVVLDISTFLPTEPLDLSVCQPDFVIGSFYHMLGYPPGIGFLLIKRSSFSIHRTGSTLKLVALRDKGKDFHIVSEDGSVNLLSFAALSIGLDHLLSVGLIPIQKRVRSLAGWLLKNLALLRHKGDEGKPLLKIYGAKTAKKRGNIVAFNVVDSTGNIFPSGLVQRLAEKNNILIGAGKFSNPGLANALSLSSEKIHNVSMLYRDSSFAAVRVSLGLMSAFQDVYRLVQFLSRFRDEDYLSTEAIGYMDETDEQVQI